MGPIAEGAAIPTSPKPATPVTAQVNRDSAASYDTADRRDLDDADRGFIAPLPGRTVGPGGNVVFDQSCRDWPDCSTSSTRAST